MPAPAAAPPVPKVMCPLDLDEHPRHDVRDALVAALALIAFLVSVLLLAP